MKLPAAKLYLYDFDGVIVDSSGLKHELFTTLAEKRGAGLGAALDQALRTELIGADRDRVAGWLVATRPEVDKAAFLRDFAAALAARLRDVKAVAGVVDFLAAARKAGIPQAIVSQAPRGDIALILGAVGIDAATFVSVSGSEDGKKIDAARAALAARKVEPGETILFGDMPSDLAVARGLGLRFVRVRSHGGALCVWPEAALPTIDSFSQVGPLFP